MPTGTVDLPTTNVGSRQERRQRVDRGVQLTQIGSAAGTRRGAQRQKVHIGPVRNFGVIGGEPQPSRGGMPLQQRLEADLEDV